jgi:hypothetical protein
MSKFTSHDGVDNHGVRAEVVVQIGTGTIAGLNPKGKANSDGTYRNMEIVFTPDNPKLLRKVYGMLDTTSNQLWNYVKTAQAESKNISFRIESQRRRTVDRNTPFQDLNHSEDVIRVIAAIDDIFSHEALTSPQEDPQVSRAPSALINYTPPVIHSNLAAGTNAVGILTKARQDGLPQGIVDALAAQALLGGASAEEVLSAGFSVEKESTRPVSRTLMAVEERPWTLYNSDGRINPGSYWVAHVASAHRFATEFVISRHESLDIVLVEGAKVTRTLLSYVLITTDSVASRVLGSSFDRQKNSYNKVMGLVFQEVQSRQNAPMGEADSVWEAWSAELADVVSGQFTQILDIAQTWLEQPTTPPVKLVEPVVSIQLVEISADDISPGVVGVKASFQAHPFPAVDSSAFIVPDTVIVERLKSLCEAAQVAKHPRAVATWLEERTGRRSARAIHAPVLVAFVEHYEALGSNVVNAEVSRSLVDAF